MDKRYQVFVSSTYADLKDERRAVIQALMEMDCIPAGMELFPAVDEEQWAFIRKIIDDCDYYIVIIGGRYGSTTAEGISYTEKEYDYAIEQGLKVLAFLHQNPGDIPVSKSDLDPELRKRLEAFREKLSKGRLVKFWQKPEELPGLVALSLSKTIKTYPAVGWIRADHLASQETLFELNELRKQSAELEKELARIRSNTAPLVENLASLDASIAISGEHYINHVIYTWKAQATWKEIFALLAPYLLENPNDKYVEHIVTRELHKMTKTTGSTVSLNPQDYQTIKIQLMALGLVSVDYLQTVKGGMALFWSLTKKGKDLLMTLRSIKA